MVPYTDAGTDAFRPVHDTVMAYAAIHLVGRHRVRPVRDLNLVYVSVRAMDAAVAGAVQALLGTADDAPLPQMDDDKTDPVAAVTQPDPT